MSRWTRAIAIVGLVVHAVSVSSAFGKAPTLTNLFPAGAERGTTATVTMSGSFDHWPVGCWVDGAGLSLEAGKAKGTLTVHVAPDAEPGVRWLRVFDEEGATNLRPFLVGTLPEVMEAEPNDDPRRPQEVGRTSATVNGRLARPGDVDGYAVKLERGQRLVADLEANRHLGSPMDAVLQVVSPAGSVVSQNDDTVGRDPRIAFDVPTGGVYIVRVFAFPATPDSSIRFAGGSAYIYRLTLATGGFLEHVFPLAVSGDGPASVAAIGSNLAASHAALSVPRDDRRERVPVFDPYWGGIADVRRIAGTALIEHEPNDPARPQVIPDHCAVSARIDPPGDRDVFQVRLEKAEKYVVRVESRELGLPLDAVLRVQDEAGKVLSESDDVGDSRDPQLTFSPPADGAYRVTVRDLHGRGGPPYAYLLRVFRPEPDFTLSLTTDKFDVASGKEAKVIVAIARKDGFGDMIEVAAEGLPEGVEATPVRSRQSDASSRSVTLTLRANARSRSGAIRIVARSADRKSRLRVATAPLPGFETRTDHLWLTVRPAAGPKKP